MNIAELEFLHRQWESLESVSKSCADNIILARVMQVLFPSGEGTNMDYSQITFEMFLKAFYYWKVTPIHEKVERKLMWFNA